MKTEILKKNKKKLKVSAFPQSFWQADRKEFYNSNSVLQTFIP